MNTGNYIAPNEIIFMAAGMAGDKDFRVIPNGFYLRLISDAFEELNLESKMLVGRKDFPVPSDTLTIKLPEDCFNVTGVFIYSGEECRMDNSKKLWWKRNYYTNGKGYIANNKGNNAGDPFMSSSSTLGEDKSLIRYNSRDGVNRALFYNVENGNLMISSSCLGAGTKIHLVYNSTGCPVGDAPIIPIYFKSAIQDYVIESALRLRMANETSMARTWQSMQQLYERRLDKEGFYGSWHTAIQRVRDMNDGQRSDFADYLSKAAWATGR